MMKNKSEISVANMLHNGATYRRFQLIFIITFEMIFFALLLLIFSPPVQKPLALGMMIISIIIAFCGLIVLKKYYCTNFSGYLLVSLVLSVTVIGNLLVGGPGTSFFAWFYITPVIASVLLGLMGLIVFGSISTAIVVAHVLWQSASVYASPDALIWSVQLINYSFVLLLILTVLTTFLLQNQQHEKQSLCLQKALEMDREKFHYLSKHDELTNLPNRAYFYAAFKTLVKKIKRDDVITLFFMDLNNLKTVNDQYGHDAGDYVLIQTSKRLIRCFREYDVVARVGGDEFTALVVHDKKDGIEKVIINRIHKAFQNPLRGDIRELKCEFSIGLATYPDEAKDIKKLMDIADKRMFKEKKRLKKNIDVTGR